MFKKVVLFCFLAVFSVLSYGQSNFSQGQELFMGNNPAQAVVFLERALGEDPANALVYLYLGVVYEQLGRMDEAIAVYRRILPTAGNLSANVANNLGNVYFRRGDNTEAESFYTQAVNFDGNMSVAFLGRANTRIQAGNLLNAITDYERYLMLEPLSSQRGNIEQLINMIRSEIAAEEMRRVIAVEEERRLAEERQKLLDAVAASLQSAAEAGQTISVGSENIELYDWEIEPE
ncbi:MAG: tetratricopeptide repeat protein [Treponema sp.]|jgi:tetratricopeptide (TPR) repeat protein|nr:tetratricopeptide repeat protein [Treponema sp.]